VRRIGEDGSLGTSTTEPALQGSLVQGGHRNFLLSISGSASSIRPADGIGNPAGDARAFQMPPGSSSVAFAANDQRMLIVSSSRDELGAVMIDLRSLTASPKFDVTFGAAAQSSAAVAGGDHGFAVAWLEDSGEVRAPYGTEVPRYDGYVARVDLYGRPRSLTRLNPPTVSAAYTRLAWNGSSYDVAWIEYDGTDGTLRTNRIADDGTLVDRKSQSFGAAGCAFAPDLASNGDVTLVVWMDCTQQDIFAARMRDGRLLEWVPLPITRGHSGSAPRVAWNGETFVVMWMPRYEAVVAARVTTGLTLLDPQAIVVSSEIDLAPTAAIASSGVESLIVYSGRNQLEARFLSGDGTVSAPIVVDGPDPSTRYVVPSVTWQRDHYVLAWCKQQSLSGPTLPGTGRFAARVTRTGKVEPFLADHNYSSWNALLASSDDRLLLMFERAAGEAPWGGSWRVFLQLYPWARMHPVGR